MQRTKEGKEKLVGERHAGEKQIKERVGKVKEGRRGEMGGGRVRIREELRER